MSDMPGIRAIGIGAFDSVNRIVKTATGVLEIATSFGVGTIARIELKNTTTNFVENGISGGDSRSKGVTGNVIAILNMINQDVATVALVEELFNGEVVLFIEMKNGDIFVAGSQNGALAITGDMSTGGTTGDLNGATVTFNTLEPDFARGYLLTAPALVEYAAALMAYV